jgi:GNAT superfamily N-acetyltransferase
MMGNTPVIHPARADDAAGIAATLRDLGWFAHIQDEPVEQTERRVAEQLARCAANGDHTVLVAEGENGQITGYLAAHWFANLMKGGDGYISELFIREAARGKGLGGRFLAAIEEEGKLRGCTRLMLFNRRERESYQRGFYQNHGWEERDDAALFNRWLTEDL